MPDYRHLLVALTATLTTLAVAHLANWISSTGMLAGAVLLGAA